MKVCEMGDKNGNYRAVTCSVQVLDNEEALTRAFELSRHVWNQLRYQACKRKDEEGNYLPYPGKGNLDKLSRPFWAFQELGRSADHLVKLYHANMLSFFENVKRDKTFRPPKYQENPMSVIFDTRQMKAAGNFEYRLTCLGGREKGRHCFIKVHVRPGVKMIGITQIRIKPDKRKGRYQAVLIREKPVSMGVQDEHIAAIDLGLVNLGAMAMTTGETFLYSGKAVLDVMRVADKRVSKCKPSNWSKGKDTKKQSKRRKAYHNKAYYTMDLAIRNFTTSVVRECKSRGVSRLVVGDLTGIREGADYGKKTNQKLHRWPQAKIREQLRYKCEDAGIEYEEISEAYTSQTCSGCNQRRKSSRVSRGLYKCNNCGLQINADVNGAVNMLKKVSPDVCITMFGVEANFPSLPSPDCGHGMVAHSSSDLRIGKPPQHFANLPHFVAKFDLRNWAVLLTQQVVVGDMCTVNM